MRRLYPARCWDVWCLVEVPGAGMPEPRVGQLVLSEGAHYQDGHGPMGVPDGSFVPAGGGMHGSSMPGAGKPMTSAGTPGALRGCLLPGCSVSSRGARWVGCPVGMPSGEGARWWGCPVAGYPVLAGDAQYGGSRAAGWPEPGGGARRRGCGGAGARGAVGYSRRHWRLFLPPPQTKSPQRSHQVCSPRRRGSKRCPAPGAAVSRGSGCAPGPGRRAGLMRSALALSRRPRPGRGSGCSSRSSMSSMARRPRALLGGGVGAGIGPGRGPGGAAPMGNRGETEAGEVGETEQCPGVPMANSCPGEPGGAGWRRG